MVSCDSLRHNKVRFLQQPLSKIDTARGKRADTYLLGLPEEFRDLAKASAWRKGKIHGIRPVFRALGAPAALVYEAIERGRHSPTTTDIIRTTGMSRPTVAKELIVLAELSMIERHDGLWQLVHATNLTSIAEWMGVQADYEEQRSLVKAQRRLWHAHLERHLVLVVYEEDLYDQERSEWDPWIPNDYGELNALERHLLAA